MPKIVDHEEQRRFIAKAAVDWIATHGVETLSLRGIAAISGRSKGNIQHYFPDKKALMFAALRHVSGKREEQERFAGGAGEPFASLCHRLHAVLPVDRERADAWRVRLSLYVHANHDPEMQAYLADHADAIQQRGTVEVRAAQDAGQIRRDLDPDLTFRRLSAAVSGIAVAALANGGRLSPDQQREMLSEVLKSITA